MKSVPLLLLFSMVVLPRLVWGADGDMRTWRAIGGFKTQASFVSYDAGVVRLRKKDGEEVSVRIERLHPSDRMDVIRMAGENARGVIPAGEIRKPTGRREITWDPINRGAPWPDSLSEQELSALESVGRTWKHAESRFFILHYQSLSYARRVARMADFQYQFIAADLPGFEDRFTEKSHIIVVRDREEWQEFLSRSGSFPTWAAAFVRGDTMFLFDLDNSEANAAVLAHEMSHLVLNRFFVHRPPLWLNEGLAEWYGNMGHEAFKGQKVDPERGMGKLDQPFPLTDLVSLPQYPTEPEAIARYYATSKQVVGMLMLRKDQPSFLRFLKEIVVNGRPFTEPLSDVYGLTSHAELEQAFLEFLD